MNLPIIYIYKKEKSVVVLNYDEALKKHSDYLDLFYEHRFTINAQEYIKSLLKKRTKQQLWDEIQSLKK